MNESEYSVRDIFAEALEITDAGQRAAFLDRACGANGELRREVEELIQAEAAAGEFLPDEPSATTSGLVLQEFMEAAEGFGPLPAAIPTQKPGDRIGRYELLEKIGEGGCGVVYLAHQEAPVRRRVALKVIKLGMDTRQVIARFEAERQALARMDHPNIAKVFDAGATDTGRPYFVMELARGCKITDYCVQNQLPTRARLELFIQVCQAVQHAHQKGIIHRDLKPSNILVAVTDGVPMPKVIDFGIAKATEGKLTDQTLFTAFEQFLGTPAYMSPEQAAITGVDIDTRSDIYSLGVLLYELLTGSTPFDTKELLALGMDELRRTIREKAPVRPSKVVERTSELRLESGRKRGGERGPAHNSQLKSLSTDLDWIVMKCLEKDRARRYGTANGLAADIRRHLNNEPVIARPPSRFYEFQKTVRRHKVGFAATAAVILALLLGIGALAYGLYGVRAERDTQKRISYASDMGLCWEAWTWSDYMRCRRLLAANVPRSGERDLRSFEWWYLSRLTRSDEQFALGTVRGNVRRIGFLPGERLVVAAPMVPAPGTANLLDFEPAGRGLVFWDWKSRRYLTQVGPAINDFAVSPDGKWIAAVTDAHIAQLMDGSSYHWDRTLPYTNDIENVAFSPGGRILALRGRETNIYLVDIVSNAPPQILQAYQIGTEKPAFSLDGHLLAFMAPEQVHRGAEPEMRLGLWDVENRRLSASLRIPDRAPWEDGVVVSHAFSSNGLWLASGDSAGRVFVHELRTGTVRPFGHHRSFRASVTFSPDGRLLASAAWDGIIKVWETATGNEIATFQGQDSAIRCLEFAPGGDYLLSGGSTDGRIRVWDVRGLLSPRADSSSEHRFVTGLPRSKALDVRPLQTGAPSLPWVFLNRPWLPPHDLAASNGIVSSAEPMKPQGDLIDVGAMLQGRSPNGRFPFYPNDWHPPPAVRQDTVLEFPTGPSSALSPNARFLVDCPTNGVGRVRDLETGSETEFPLAPGESIRAISPDGHNVATGFTNGRLVIRAPPATNGLATNGTHGLPITVVEFSPDGSKLATVGRDFWLRVWNSQNLDLLAQAPLPSTNYWRDTKALAFAPSNNLIASANLFEGKTLLLDLKSKRSWELKMPFPLWDTVHLAFSPDGERLAITSSFDRAAIYDCRSWRLSAAIGGKPSRALGRVAFTPDGKRLALSIANIFTLWDIESNRQLLEFPEQDGALSQIRFNPAGDRLVIIQGSVCRVYSAPRSPPREAVSAPAGIH